MRLFCAFSRSNLNRFPNSTESTISMSDSVSLFVPNVRIWWRSKSALPSGWLLSLCGAFCIGIIVEHPCMHRCLFCALLYQEHSARAGLMSMSNLLRKSFPRIKSIPLGRLGSIAHCACILSVAKFSWTSTP